MKDLIWAWGNKCSTLHVLPKKEFVPSICGFTPSANRGGTAKWKIANSLFVEELLGLREKTFSFRKYSLCEKCKKLSAEE